MHTWYYAESGEQRGPISTEDLQSKLGRGALEPDALVWSEGMAEWKPANSVAALWVSIPQPARHPQTPPLPPTAVSPYAPPAAPPQGEVDWSGYVPDGPQIRPWVRYVARTLDFLTFCMFFGGFGMAIYPEIAEMGDVLLGVVLLACYNFYEPVMLVLFGTTPFKALLRIRLRNKDGSKLNFWQALRRTFSLWVAGQGLGIPIATLITSVYSYSRLTSQGITSWDQSGNFTVSHQRIQWWRWLLVIGTIFGLLTLMGVGSEP